MKLLKTIIVACFIIALNCTKAKISILVDNVDKGQVLINNLSFQNYIVNKHGFSKCDTLYFLRLQKYNNSFRFIFADSSIIDTTIQIRGEKYYTVDMLTGELNIY